MKKTWGACLVLMALAGCASKYQPGGWGGGFSEVQLDKNLFKVTFSGNAYTGIEQAQNYALIRDAEVTLQHGFTHFAVVEDRSRVDTSTFVTPVETTTKSRRKDSGEVIERSTSTGGHAITDEFPTAVHTIRTFTKRPDNVAGIVYDARFVCGSLGKKYGITCGQTVAAK